MISGPSFDNNSLDRVQAQQPSGNRPASNMSRKKMSINRKNLAQNNISSQQQINNAYQGEETKTQAKSQQKVNKRTASMKDNSKQALMQIYQSDNMPPGVSMLNQGTASINRQNRNTLFIGGSGINAGMQFAYNNNMAQARQNTKESQESSVASKTRNGGLSNHNQ